ncbi:hypothetical protein GCM10022267_50650 [Lentzea roselyniae]|uniref:PKD domain-containing protein n=1 Tax=Lentzea roselyniae TaxID=531940 RepID=A0ABP7BH57_9PSEU
MAAVAFTAAVVALLAPGTALAASPGDDFDNPVEVTALPTNTTIDTTGATRASDDPAPCNYDGEASTWLRYTAPADGLVRLSTTSNRYGPFFGVFTGARGALTEVPGACTGVSNIHDETFHVKAGTTYHIALIEYYSWYQGPVTINMRSVQAAPNDDHAAATTVTVPTRVEGDLSRASAEPGEAPPSCDQAATQSLWYRYTATRTGFVSAGAPYKAVSVHRTDLAELDCIPSGSNADAVFAATAGETYLVRVASSEQNAGAYRLDLQAASPIKPTLYQSWDRPTVFDDIPFSVYLGDPHNRELVSGTIDFGDGQAIPINSTSAVWHRYARDGEYTVTITGSTADGRTGTGSTTVKIDTHDVSVAGLSVSASARAGQTKPVKVFVANTRQSDDVVVRLYRVKENSGGYDELVGEAVQRVAASPTGRVEFPFVYTYTAADAAVGKVEFRAVAQFSNWNVRDAKPEDNELRASTTTVRPAAVANMN